MAESLIKVDVGRMVTDVLGRVPRKGDTARILRGLTAAATAFWKKEAVTKLRSTSRDYVFGIQKPDVGPSKAVITLLGVLPNLVEQGFAGGDMRKYMLSGPRARIAKAGHRYLIVPFRHGTPGTGGRNVGRPMPPEVYAGARKLGATVSRPGEAVGGRPGRTVRYGERLGPSSAGLKAAGRRILESKERPWHATSIYTGMIREEKQFAKATQTTGYMSFRVLSEKTKRADEHWLHPGIRPRRFAANTARYVARITKDIVAASVK